MRENANEPFVRNAWYIAAWPEELETETGFVARTIMNQPLVIFRGADGKVAALEDRCCHRGAPLSMGVLKDNGIMCGYHGLVFDGTGRCVDIPGQKTIPSLTRVRSFPLVERQQILWIWMGDPAKADDSLIVDYPFHDQPDKWPHKKACLHFETNYMMLMDNVMDPAHIGYIHAKTIGGNPEAHENVEFWMEETERGFRSERWMIDVPAPPSYVRALGFTGKVDRWHRREFIAPTTVLLANGAIEAGRDARHNTDQPGAHFRILHHATPETETSFHYFFSLANGYRQDDPAATQQLYDETIPTFLEDKVIMEAQQRRINLDPARDLMAIATDKAVMAARRAVRKMIEAERAATAQRQAAE